ncbi:phage head completion protein [Nocardia asiatica]|uniref:phage head completion protein n=1 Tax=Nocardia asiatica TaxID=209252 RepID=UPI002454899F|nr:head-tail adaptor protein [Nocardia asiatica]
MSETVIRHRGGGRDEDGNPIPWTDVPLVAVAVAPGATAEYVERARDGQHIECTVYFRPAVDLTGADELTVGGDRYRVQVEQWKPRRAVRPGRLGTVALCSRGEG